MIFRQQMHRKETFLFHNEIKIFSDTKIIEYSHYSLKIMLSS